MKEECKLYAAALGGAFFLVIADLTSNIDAATTLKLGKVLEKYIFGATAMGPGVIGLALVLVISAFFCWLYSPEDKVAAFTRGLSVFAVLNAITPYSIVSGSSTSEQVQTIQLRGGNTQISSLVRSAYADQEQTNIPCRPGILDPNAMLVAEKRVSSCRPYYSGFLGLGSFFNNTIEYCESKYTLQKNTKVKLLQSWETGLRVYRYSQVEFQAGNQVCTGWVSDGRKEIRYVVPE